MYRLIGLYSGSFALKKRIELPLNYGPEKVRKIILSKHITDAVYFKMNGKFFDLKSNTKNGHN